MTKLVRFRGYEFILDNNGALATRDVMARGAISFAHVYENGSIMCLKKVIGHADEIVILDEDAPSPEVGFGVLFASWSPADWDAEWSDRKHILIKDVTPKRLLSETTSLAKSPT